MRRLPEAPKLFEKFTKDFQQVTCQKDRVFQRDLLKQSGTNRNCSIANESIEQVHHRLADAVGLRALGFGTRMIDVLDRPQVEFVLVSFRIATMLAAMVG